MRFSLDFRSKVPIYTQIVEQVKAQIAAGVLQGGDQLPTVREVAADLQINFNTVARAYRSLHDEGLISTQQGRGTYILAQAAPHDADQRGHAGLSRLVGGWLAEAARMGFRPDEVERAWDEAFAQWGAGQVLKPE